MFTSFAKVHFSYVFIQDSEFHGCNILDVAFRSEHEYCDGESSGVDFGANIRNTQVSLIHFISAHV